FMPGMYLFPGGALDPGDTAAAVASRCAGLDDARTRGALGLPSGGLAYWAAAIRESFEEAGVLLAYDDEERLVNPGESKHVQRFEAYRSKLNTGAKVSRATHRRR